MLLSEVKNFVLQESGQFVVGDLSCIGWQDKQFLDRVVIPELKLYDRFRPITYRFQRRADQIANGQASIFFSNADPLTGAHDGSHDAGLVFNHRVGIFNRDPGRVPKWVSEVIPTNVLTTAGILYLIQETRFINTSERSILHEPRTFMWHYEHDDDHGILYTTETGRMDVTAKYDTVVIDMLSPLGAFLDAELQFREEGTDRILLDLILARFLIALGRSRRTFSLNNSPINFDAAELVAEGTELRKETLELLYQQSHWYDAIGV